jgi:hypothetical protein
MLRALKRWLALLGLWMGHHPPDAEGDPYSAARGSARTVSRTHVRNSMPSEATNRATRREWRELGFFYLRDDRTKVWTLAGSRAGLLVSVMLCCHTPPTLETR